MTSVPGRGRLRQPDPYEFIQCLICGRWYRILTNHLIYKHEEQPTDYKGYFGVRFVVCDAVRSLMREQHLYWNRERIAEKIRRRFEQGKPVYAAAMKRERRLGSWRRAVGAAGLDYEGIQRQRIWSEAKIVEAIKARTALGLPMNF